MSGFTINTIVSQQEAEELKEIIFRRAQERSDRLAEETKNTYTSTVQSDIMDLARLSFEKEKNPFAKVVSDVPEKKAEEKKPEEQKNMEEIGFAKRHVKDIQEQLVNKNKIINKDFSNMEVEKAMLSARMDYKKNSSFVGALEFLNSQATIALIKTKGDSFDAIA